METEYSCLFQKSQLIENWDEFVSRVNTHFAWPSTYDNLKWYSNLSSYVLLVFSLQSDPSKFLFTIERYNARWRLATHGHIKTLCLRACTVWFILSSFSIGRLSAVYLDLEEPQNDEWLERRGACVGWESVPALWRSVWSWNHSCNLRWIRWRICLFE